MQRILDRIVEYNIVIGVPIVCAGCLMVLIGLIFIPRAGKAEPKPKSEANQ